MKTKNAHELHRLTQIILKMKISEISEICGLKKGVSLWKE